MIIIINPIILLISNHLLVDLLMFFLNDNEEIMASITISKFTGAKMKKYPDIIPDFVQSSMKIVLGIK